MTRSRRTIAVALAVVTLVAFGLRLYRLDAQSLWYDEGVTATVTQYSLPDLTRWTAADIQPPLYYYMVALWGRLAGWGEWSLRFPSAFFGALAVPLLAAMAIRLSRSRMTGLFAGLLAAIHPMLVYYGQEARMYAMLVAVVLVAGYCAVRLDRSVGDGSRPFPNVPGSWEALPAGRGRPGRRAICWFGYVAAATAATYTHYFAFFLMAALAAAITASQFSSPRGAGTRPLVTRFFLANGAVLLLYAPWLGILAMQLQVDASYWQGSLKLWEAVRHVAISFTSGETVLEGQAIRLLAIYGAVTLVALVGLTARSRQGGRLPLYALLWLAVPVVAVTLLASLTPKFNPRYVMVALPGLLLVWSGGLAEMGRRAGNGVGRAGSLLAAAALLAGFAYADYHWYFNPAFSKEQWRELASYVQAHWDGDEAVILVSGHAWPVWRYYAPELAPVRLPAIEILDVNAVLDFANTGGRLRQDLSGAGGAWLIGWQDDVVDPMGVVPLQLSAAGQEVTLGDGFWGLSLRHFTALDAAELQDGPPITHAANTNFGSRVELLGYTVRADGELLLFWQLLADAEAADLLVTGETFTAERAPYARLADRRPAGYQYPTFRWQGGQVTVGRIPASDWAGEAAFPGDYRLHLGVYDPAGDQAGLDVLGPHGERLGKRAILELRLDQPTGTVGGEDPSRWGEIVPGLHAELVLSEDAVAADRRVLAQVHWYAARPLREPLAMAVRWRPRRDGEAAGMVAQPLSLPLPADQWPVGVVLRSAHWLRPPPGTAPGEYWLEVGPGDGRPVARAISVLPGFGLLNAAPLALPIDADFGGQLRLVGLQEPIPATIRSGELLSLALVWAAEAVLEVDYRVSVQLLDEEGQLATQSDVFLPGGSVGWLPGQVTSHILELQMPEQPGNYRVIAAVYDPDQPGLPRLPMASGQDFVELGMVRVQSGP